MINLNRLASRRGIKNWPFWFSIAIAIIFSFFLLRSALARLAWQKYRWPNAAILLDGNNADLALYIGNYYFNGMIGGGEYNPNIAEKAFKKAILINRKILWGHYQLARIYFIEKNYNRALEEVNRELESNPENLRSLYVRGLIYGYRGQAEDFEKAETDFRRFTSWAPKEWAGYNDLAWILSKQEKYLETEKTINLAFKEAINAQNNPWLWNNLGVAQLNLKNYKAAKKSFEKTKQLAEKITINEWRQAYPGNNPATSSEGISAFLKTINKNLSRAENKN